jgi:NhaP-type Na+/H+ or K+/H+ antiporter
LGVSLQFGSLLGATDPVAVLALFLELNVDPMLYSLVFGESVLNDAVAIVLFHSFETVKNTFGILDFLIMLGLFVGKSLGAFLIGAFLSYTSAFLMKRMENLKLSATFNITFMLCVAYFGYFITELLGMSGVITIFICGIIMSHHHWYCLPEPQRPMVYSSFGSLAFFGETMTFILVGTTILNPSNLVAEHWNPLFILYIIVHRFLDLVLLINYLREIVYNSQRK